MDYRLRDPEDMTPEERLDRIAEILADACIRLMLDEKPAESALSGSPGKPPISGGGGLDSV